MNFRFVLILSLVLGIGFSIDVDHCQTINASGTYGVTNASLIGANESALNGQACIVLNFRDITFDCNGTTIANNQTANSYGIYATNGTNITIKNCANVANYSYGIYSLGANDSVVRNNTVFNSSTYNYVLNGTLTVTVEQNTARNSSVFGFAFLDSTFLTIRNNSAYYTRTGFQFVNVSGGSVTSNIANNNTQYGFSITSTNNSNFTSNTAYSNTLDGLNFESGDNNTIGSNTFYLNENGIKATTTTYNDTYTNNTIYNNSLNGIWLGGGINLPTTLSGNTIFNNTLAGALISIYPTNITADHYYNNGVDFNTSTAGSAGTNVNLTGVIFDSPGGNYANYTNLSLRDAVNNAGYTIDWDVNTLSLPGGYTSFEQKFVTISNFSGAVSIDTITWNWLQSETSGYLEGNFELWKYNSTDGWVPLNNTPDTGSNTLALSAVNKFSMFTIFQNNTQTPNSGSGGNGGGSGKPDLEVALDATCNDNLVTITSGSKKIVDANVFVNGDPLGSKTDSNGQVSFAFACGETVTVKAAKSGYDSQTEDFETVSCNLCKPPEVTCSCGVVQNNQCVPYQCCSNAGCGTSQVCTNHACVDKPECTSNADCAGNEKCTSGKCEDVVGKCGYTLNHVWVNYQCGDSPDCPACPSGSVCTNNKCVQNDVKCPTSGFVGDKKTCSATTDGNACVNCDYKVTDPSGKVANGKTDAKGNFELSLSEKGSYLVSLLKNGGVVKSVTVQVVPKSTPDEPTKPVATDSGLSSLLWLLLLLIIIVIAVIYLRRRGEKGKAK